MKHKMKWASLLTALFISSMPVVQAQDLKLRADNIDEIVQAMTLQEKVLY